MLHQPSRWLAHTAIITLLLMIMFFGPISAQSDEEKDAAENVILTDSVTRPLIDQLEVRPIPLIQQADGPTAAFRPTVDIRLSPVDVEALRQEDETLNQQLRKQRVGIVRPLPEVVSSAMQTALGRWQTAKNDKQFWVLTIESPEAQAIRIHLENLQLPPGAQIIVYNSNDLQEAYGPYNAQNLADQSDLWTASVFGAQVTLEYSAPASMANQAIPFTIKEISHVYVNPNLFLQAQEGNCHNDVTCHTSWASQAKGTARYTLVEGGSSYLCSGALLNDLDSGTYEDYFLTANHCVNSQTVASTTEFFWFYQTSTCNGTPPPLSSVPRTTGGADLLSASSANDHALMRIRNQTPNNVIYLGWTTAALSQGNSVTGIHHPTGAYKRISFGSVTGSDTNFWATVWSSGVTEGGSSGSPLFNADKRIVGQLWGGASSCTVQNGTDTYGRFNQTYPSIRRWMEIGGTINVDSAYSGVEQGTPTQPFRTAASANNFAWRDARIRFKAGSYTGAITFDKPVTLIADGGTVTIGN
jgi:hypothetical protein